VFKSVSIVVFEPPDVEINFSNSFEVEPNVYALEPSDEAVVTFSCYNPKSNRVEIVVDFLEGFYPL